jgi:hypothetical protein
MRAALLAVAAAALRRRKLDPFDCYVEKGESYPGLADTTETGRKCQNWLSQEPHTHSYGPADTGLGNHQYCRNPGASKDKPWCYTLDSSKEWEYCKIPQCPEKTETPEPWVAPEGSKSEGEPTPCVPEEPAPQYEAFEIVINGSVYDQGVCRSGMGKTNWLIGAARFVADDQESCIQECLMTAGAEYAVHYETPLEGGDNCACFRDCIPTEDAMDGAINMPLVFRLRPPSLLQKPPCVPKKVDRKLKEKKSGVPNLWREARTRAMKKQKK